MKKIEEWDIVKITGKSTPATVQGTYGVVRDVNQDVLVVSVNHFTKVGVLAKDVIKVGTFIGEI